MEKSRGSLLGCLGSSLQAYLKKLLEFRPGKTLRGEFLLELIPELFRNSFQDYLGIASRHSFFIPLNCFSIKSYGCSFWDLKAPYKITFLQDLLLGKSASEDIPKGIPFPEKFFKEISEATPGGTTNIIPGRFIVLLNTCQLEESQSEGI